MKRATSNRERRHRKSGFRSFITFLSLAATVAAIWDQLRRPAAERTWHGQVFGFVPYDFRMPTAQKLLRAYWDPENNNMLKDKAFGVGWDVNLAAVWTRFKEAPAG